MVHNNFEYTVIERCDKETEELIASEKLNFLTEPLLYLKKNQNEFLYVESPSFESIRVDAIVLELDDVFGTYTAMFGLKLQKKFGIAIKAYLDEQLKGEGAKHSVMFSDKDGLWEVNFALNYAEGFNEELSLEEAYQFTYRFIEKLIEAVAVNQ